MGGLYIDTSALGRALLDEPDAPAIRATIAGYDVLWSSALLRVELIRLARREGLAATAESLLADVTLVPISAAALRGAEVVEPDIVRTLDAIHLQAALALRKRGDVEAVLTFDEQLQAGCRHHSLRVEAPTAGGDPVTERTPEGQP